VEDGPEPVAYNAGTPPLHRASQTLFAALLAFAAPGPACRADAAAPGFFRVSEEGGRWWLVDPEGRPFFSTGVNLFHAGSDPARYDPRAPEYAALRLYPGFEAWCATARERLRAWGFNTLGAWADERAAACAGLPYAVSLDLGRWVGSPWIDPASPRAQARLRALVAREVAPRRDDRNLVGWFLDNELRWYEGSLFGYWACEHGRERLKKLLYEIVRERYGSDLGAFLADFDVEPRPRRFADLAGRLRRVVARPGRRPGVVSEFVERLAGEHYRVLSEMVRAADPNHLLLGDRYASSYSQAVARAAALHVDVVSVNCANVESGGWIAPSFLDSLHRVTGRPILVSETYVAARENQSGNRNAHGFYLVVDTQAERADTAEGLAAGLAGLPYVVGYHWFQWSDQPAAGREDGEDFDMGLVDLDDRPYELLTAALARVHARAPELHRSGPPSRGIARANGDWAVPRADVARDGLLGEWDLPRHWAPGAVADGGVAPFGDLYLAWRPEGLVVGLDMQDDAPGPPAPDPRDGARLIVSTERAGGGAASAVVTGLARRAGEAATPLAAADAAGLSGAQELRNMRTTAEVLVPASFFGREALRAGDVLDLGVALVLDGGGRALRWPARHAAVLRLVPPAKAPLP
jgi:hypothetical protein